MSTNDMNIFITFGSRTKTSYEYVNLTILFTYYIHFQCIKLSYSLYTLCTIDIHLIIQALYCLKLKNISITSFNAQKHYTHHSISQLDMP